MKLQVSPHVTYTGHNGQDMKNRHMGKATVFRGLSKSTSLIDSVEGERGVWIS